jgi:hypothetical protein
MDRACANCDHSWDPAPGVAPEDPIYCRRYPPDHALGWPETSKKSRCGEWTRAKKLGSPLQASPSSEGWAPPMPLPVPEELAGLLRQAPHFPWPRSAQPEPDDPGGHPPERCPPLYDDPLL